MSSTLLVDTAGVGFEGSHEVFDHGREGIFAQPLDEHSQTLGSRRTSFWHGIDENIADAGDKLRQVGDKILGICKGGHVPDDLGTLALDLCASLPKTTIDDGHDLSYGGSAASDSAMETVRGTVGLTRAREEVSM